MRTFAQTSVRYLTILLLAGTLSFVAVPQSTEASTNYCLVWAKELRKAGTTTSAATYELHRRGCRRPYSTWQPDTTNRCARLAYRKAKSGYRKLSLNIEVGRYGHCVLYEDGSWGPE